MPEYPVPTPRRRRGRPRGASDAREAIEHAAVAEFGERGYDSATIRGIAARAGVDAALVHHYFGTKDALFTSVIGAPLHPSRQLPEVLAGDLDGAGERIARFVVGLWEQPEFRRRGVAVMRSMVGNRGTASLMRGFVTREILRRVADALPGDPAADKRAALVASQIVGLIITRYVIEMGPMAEADGEEVITAIAPTLQRYLTGDIASAR